LQVGLNLKRPDSIGIRIRSQLESPQGFLHLYSPARALPPVTAQVPFIKAPMLILQGMNDANTPEPYLMTLQQAIVQARGRATIKRYAGLGHTLGPASSMVDDNFRPIAPAPLSDMAEWILRH
uniref:alpha/beta hydrolase family protein n=1 Tax=Deinococcus wulumuqiensis TaxID=980427 RepID=UPI003C6C2D33